jgi:hypothetical protein
LSKLLTVCGVVLFGALMFSSVAGAAECGSSAGGETQLGALLLRPEDSVTELSFKRDKKPRRLIFEFDVENCTLPAKAQLEAKVRSSDLSVNEVFEAPIIEPEGSELAVEIPVDPGRFGAGKHTASVTMRGAVIAPTRAKVSLQRTQSAVGPTIIALICAFFGFVAALLKTDFDLNESGKTGWRRFPRPAWAAGAALVAAGAVWWTGYVKVDVWQWELGTVGTLVIGALPAAYGAATGVLQAKKPTTK